MNFHATALAALLALGSAAANAAVSADEARQLGQNLTPTGAEKAGNKAGTIPPYSGGLTAPPAAFKPGSGIRPDPFADEKPLLSIDARNMAGDAERLTEATKALMKKHAAFRIDVYRTHRTVAFPRAVVEATLRNATTASTSHGGEGIAGAVGGVPFPIPKTGHEVMWNHLTRHSGVANSYAYRSFNIDASGRASLVVEGKIVQQYPYYDPNDPAAGETYWLAKTSVSGPARRAGEILMVHDPLNPVANGRRAWQYLPGQRRTKLAPEIAYDTPDPYTSGVSTFDQGFIFNGAMDRFDFKLVGKKEMYVPYNSWRLTYGTSDEELLSTRHFANPAALRWELHRVWVVEATLKAGKRHVYAKRVFYIDEDSWTALASDEYDARGQLYKAGFAHLTVSYDRAAVFTEPFVYYDLQGGSWHVHPKPSGAVHYPAPLKARDWSADALTSSGIR